MGSTKVPTFGFGTNEISSAPKEGLYLLNIKVKNKPMVNGWFVLSRTTATANPVLRAPTPNEVFHTGNPTFQWVNFKSPEFKPFNQRKLLLSIYGRGPGPNDKAWSSSVVYPDSTDSVKLSEAPNLDGMSDLKNGRYAFKARFEERWFFGGLLIGRSAGVEVPFSVAK